MLTIDHETVCYIIIKAREFDAKMEPEVSDPGDNPIDDADREILFDYPDDPTVEEISAAIDGLNEDAAAELLALLRLGRGDFTPKEWKRAVYEALDDPEARQTEAFLGEPMLADFLEEGLSLMGYTCDDVELGRL
jgi:hypothetical protein